jgi:aminomethyltransferase
MSDDNLIRTPLYEEHIQLKGRMVPFDGFNMPVQYSGIIDEHLAVRKKVGIFDISHMGQIEIKGPGAIPFVDYLLTNQISDMGDDSIKYSPMCYPHGGQVDDLFVYKISNTFVLLITNASPNYSQKDEKWIKEHIGDFDIEVFNKSDTYGAIAVQGPLAEKLLNPFFQGNIPLADLKRFKFVYGKMFGKDILISRTGYTGEDGFEIYTLNGEDIVGIWHNSLQEGGKYGIKPCGLGARDTARFEVCYWLYGNDIDENINPLESGQGWTVKLSKESFIGRDALLKIQQEGIKRKLTGLFVPQGGIPRHGMEVFSNNEKIGYITSGNYCPFLKKVHAMAYLSLPFSQKGTKVNILVRGRNIEAEVVDMPFLAPFNRR